MERETKMTQKIRKIGIGFITGRKSFRDVLATYLNSWGGALAVGGCIDLSLFVAYDLAYNNTSRSDYTNINIELREMLSDIHFIDRNSLQIEMKSLVEKGTLTEQEASLFFERGYAGKRNAIMYTAVKQGIDVMLFLDDDEYPLSVQKQDGIEQWTGQQVLDTHLKHIDDAYITNGYHCGYISSIPNIDFNDVLAEQDFRKFIGAISNDVINWESIQTLMKSGNISYADPACLNGKATQVPQVNGSKFITGSNLCINLKQPMEVSPFYNPPDARGEDTFLATCLTDKRVLRVPTYTFHDGFSLYTSLLLGVLPQRLKHVSGNTKKIANRFYNTCIGWIRYKPLLLYITQRENYHDQIAQIRVNLNETLPKLSEYFKNPKFMKIADELNKYDKNVELHHKAMIQIQGIWIKLVRDL
ncbi:hypothetical protein LQZ18_11745 [Lachnospiraceae bacterium ZAX-1]